MKPVLATPGIPRLWVHPFTHRRWVATLVIVALAALVLGWMWLGGVSQWVGGASVVAGLAAVALLGFVRPMTTEPFCVMCGVRRAHAKRLVSGPNHCICDDCLGVGLSCVSGQPASDGLSPGSVTVVSALLKVAPTLTSRGEAAVRSILECALQLATSHPERRQLAEQCIQSGAPDLSLCALEAIPPAERERNDVMSLACALSDVGRPAEAMALLDLLDTLEPQTEFQRGLLFNNRVWFELEAGQPADAAMRERATTALMLLQTHRLGLPQDFVHRSVGYCLGTLARVQLALGLPQEAVATMAQARAERWHLSSASLVAEAQAHLSLGNLEAARRCVEQVLQVCVPWSPSAQRARALMAPT